MWMFAFTDTPTKTGGVCTCNINSSSLAHVSCQWCRSLSCWRNTTASLLLLAVQEQCMPSWWTAGEERGRGKVIMSEVSECFCTHCVYIYYDPHPVSRHPDPHCRPAASSLCSSLNQPESLLLLWDQSTPVPSPSAHILGAPLEEGHKLYGDLQSIYQDYI